MNIKPSFITSPIKTITDRAKNLSNETITEGLLWGLPAVVIPISRKKIDKERDNGAGKELLLRDLITYTAAPVSYFFGRYQTESFLNKSKIKSVKKMGDKSKKITAVSTGMALALAWATYGAVKIPKMIAEKKEKKNQPEKRPEFMENPFVSGMREFNPTPVNAIRETMKIQTYNF